MKRFLIFFILSCFAVLVGCLIYRSGETDATAALFIELFAVGKLFFE